MCLATGGMSSVRMQYNYMAVQLITGNGIGISEDCDILCDKHWTKTEVMICNAWYKRMYRIDRRSFGMTFLLLEQYEGREMDCKWHNIYWYQILWGRPQSTVQY
jgi:hypothetical protein